MCTCLWCACGCEKNCICPLQQAVIHDSWWITSESIQPKLWKLCSHRCLMEGRFRVYPFEPSFSPAAKGWVKGHCAALGRECTALPEYKCPLCPWERLGQSSQKIPKEECCHTRNSKERLDHLCFLGYIIQWAGKSPCATSIYTGVLYRTENSSLPRSTRLLTQVITSFNWHCGSQITTLLRHILYKYSHICTGKCRVKTSKWEKGSCTLSCSCVGEGRNRLGLLG